MSHFTIVITLDVAAPSEENATRTLRLVLKQLARLDEHVLQSRIHAVIPREEPTRVNTTRTNKNA